MPISMMVFAIFFTGLVAKEPGDHDLLPRPLTLQSSEESGLPPPFPHRRKSAVVVAGEESVFELTVEEKIILKRLLVFVKALSPEEQTVFFSRLVGSLAQDAAGPSWRDPFADEPVNKSATIEPPPVEPGKRTPVRVPIESIDLGSGPAKTNPY